MDFDMEERKRQIATFSAFIDESFLRIDELLQCVGWTREHLLNEDIEMVSCPLNPEHKVPRKSLDSHVQSCTWRREGYHELDVPLPENSVANFESTKSSIVIDAPLQATIIKEAKERDPTLQTGDLETDERLVPKTSHRFIADFTSDERRVLYDFVISKTKAVEDVKVEELQMIGDMKRDEQSRPKSKLELLIEQRDAKRRRISYRKKVHTNRKSHTEVLREVIQNQMELIEQIIKEECDEDKDDAFSLGGDEINLLSNKHRERKRHHVLDNDERIHDRERDADQKMIKKEIREYRSYQSESNGSIPDDVTSGYDRNELVSKSWSERSKSYRKTESNNTERKERNEKQEYKSYKMQTSSFEDKTYYYTQDYYTQDYKNWERSRGYRTYDREKGESYRQSRRDYETSGETSQSRKYKDLSKSYSPEHNLEYRRDYESNSRHRKHSSKRDPSEHDLEYEKEYHSRSKRHKYSSKYDRLEHNEYEVRKSHNKFKKISKSDDFHDGHSEGHGLQLNKNYLRRDVDDDDDDDDDDDGDDNTGGNPDAKSFQLINIKVEKEEIAKDSRKYTEKLKKPKKKKRKHKHKSKKKHKRKYCSSFSSNSSSKTSSERSDSGSHSNSS